MISSGNRWYLQGGNMQTRHQVLLFLIVLLGAAAVFAAEEGVTDTEIHIGQFGPLTGPTSPWSTVCYGPGLVFDLANEEGGVHGRKFAYHLIDDGYNPAKTKYGVKRLQESEGMFAWIGGVGTSTGLSVMDYLMNRKIPWVGPVSGSDAWVTPPKKYLFSLYPHFRLDSLVLCRYAVEQLGYDKIAVVYQNDSYGVTGLKGVMEELERQGIQLRLKVPVEKNDMAKLKEYALQLLKSESQAVIMWTNPFHTLRIMKLCKQMGYQPQWMAGTTFSDFPQLYKLSRGLIKGLIATTAVDFNETPELKKYKSAHERLGKKDIDWGVFYHAGVGFADIVVEAFKRCGRDLTRERFVQAMETIQNYKTILPPVSFKPFDPDDQSSRQGMNHVFLMKCLEGGKHELLSDWMTY